MKRTPGFASVIKRLTDRACVERYALAALKRRLATLGCMSDLASIASTERAVVKGKPGASLKCNDCAATQTMILTGNNGPTGKPFWSESVRWVEVFVEACQRGDGDK